MKENTIIVGTPESRSKQLRLGIMSFKPPEGAEKRICGGCKKKAWLGPRQLALVADRPELKIRCAHCVAAHAKMNSAGIAIAHLGGNGGAFQRLNNN